MINLGNIYENFNKNKNVIIDLLINHYGQEYEKIIKRRLGNVLFDFSSTPEEEYNFLKQHGSEVDTVSKLLIKLRYIEYKKAQKSSKETNIKELINYIKNELLKNNFDKINFEDKTFLSLFTDDNFNCGYIDSFSSKSISLLNDSSICETLKESVLNDQKEFMRIIESFGIKLENINESDVDNFIEYRKELQVSYKNEIMQKSRYGKKLFKTLRERFFVELTLENLSKIAFVENSSAQTIKVENEDYFSYYHVIRVPLLYLYNLGIKGLDVNIIHEMIHKAETDGDNVGISISTDNTNNIINEIRTQNLAIKITKELHKLGIFIFDNPDDYVIEGESTYEALFPLTKMFVDKNEKILSDCAINNTPNKLCEYFGELWKEFSEQINNLYYKHMIYFQRTHNMPNIYVNFIITELINEMNSFKKGGNRKNV